jgi:signal transduction histidine kinase
MNEDALERELKHAKETIAILEVELIETNEGVVALNLELENEIDIRKKAEESLRSYRDHLEELVQKRTRELARTNRLLERELKDRKHAENLIRLQRDLALRLSDIDSLNNALKLCLETSINISGTDGGAIFLADAVSTNFLPASSKNMSNRFLKEVLRWLDDSDKSDQIREGKTLCFSQKDLDFKFDIPEKGEEIRFISFVSITHREKTIGFYCLVSHTISEIFSSEFEALETIAHLAGNVITQLAAEEELKRYSEHLEKIIKEREKELKEAEKFATIGQIATMVGHDLRNPLQVIINYIYLAKMKMKSLSSHEMDILEKAGFSKIFGSVQDETKYMDKIISDLQDYARPVKLDVAEINLHQLFIDRFSSIDVPQTIKIFLDIEENMTIIADPNLMKRVFSNLLLNAVQAMPNGGRVMIGAWHDEQTINITIKDTGTGISEDLISELFQPLVTTKAKGTGLGLSVVKRLVEAQNGKVELESEVGKGTTFTVRIPQSFEVIGK